MRNKKQHQHFKSLELMQCCSSLVRRDTYQMQVQPCRSRNILCSIMNAVFYRCRSGNPHKGILLQGEDAKSPHLLLQRSCVSPLPQVTPPGRLRCPCQSHFPLGACAAHVQDCFHAPNYHRRSASIASRGMALVGPCQVGRI